MKFFALFELIFHKPKLKENLKMEIFLSDDKNFLLGLLNELPSEELSNSLADRIHLCGSASDIVVARSHVFTAISKEFGENKARELIKLRPIEKLLQAWKTIS